MIIPLLLAFGLLAVFLFVDRKKHDDWGAVGWLIILLTVGLLMWGMIPDAMGFDEGIYR
jgi:hypothetical protein